MVETKKLSTGKKKTVDEKIKITKNKKTTPNVNLYTSIPTNSSTSTLLL